MDISNNARKTASRRSGTRSVPEVNAALYGKVPPQARELEEAVLGAIMMEKGAFDVVSETLRSECFYVDAHQRIFRACVALSEKDLPIDILTVCEQMKLTEELEMVGGPYQITRLTNAVLSSAHIETHARIVMQKFVQREMIRISTEILGQAYEESTDIFDLMDSAEDKLYQITNSFLKSNYTEMGTALKEAIDRIDMLRSQKEEISGVPSGFPSLDKVTFGWQKTDLVILAARPAVGKTAFALNLARNACMHPTKPTGVAFFSLEMGAAQLVQRVLSAESEVWMEKISRGRMTDAEYQQLHSRGVAPLESANLYIDDSAALNIFEFRAKARRLVNKNGVGLIIIDYLQLMSGNTERGGNREQEISSISRGLKQLAKELKVPIIALSQLSRAVEGRKESKNVPQLSDLRESGAIEQDADMVMFIYRPSYHDINADENGESNKRLTQIRIAKHRNGALETINLESHLEIQKFYDRGIEGQDPGSGFNRPPGTGGPAGFSPLGSSGGGFSPGGSAPETFVVQSSKMNNASFDDDDLF